MFARPVVYYGQYEVWSYYRRGSGIIAGRSRIMGMELSTANRRYVILSMTCVGSSIFCPSPVLSCPVLFPFIVMYVVLALVS